jgi:hypothetical protein
VKLWPLAVPLLGPGYMVMPNLLVGIVIGVLTGWLVWGRS